MSGTTALPKKNRSTSADDLLAPLLLKRACGYLEICLGRGGTYGITGQFASALENNARHPNSSRRKFQHKKKGAKGPQTLTLTNWVIGYYAA